MSSKLYQKESRGTSKKPELHFSTLQSSTCTPMLSPSCQAPERIKTNEDHRFPLSHLSQPETTHTHTNTHPKGFFSLDLNWVNT